MTEEPHELLKVIAFCFGVHTEEYKNILEIDRRLKFLDTINREYDVTIKTEYPEMKQTVERIEKKELNES